MRRCIGALMAVLLLTVVEGAAAQRGPAQRGGGARRTQMERMIRARVDGMVREQWDLREGREQAPGESRDRPKKRAQRCGYVQTQHGVQCAASRPQGQRPHWNSVACGPGPSGRRLVASQRHHMAQAQPHARERD